MATGWYVAPRIMSAGRPAGRRDWAPIARIVATIVGARALLVLGVVIGAHLSEVAGRRPQSYVFMWDGSFYRELARSGYPAGDRLALRFFPLFPWIAHVLGVVIGSDAALVLIANAAAVGATFLLWHLVRRQRGDAAAMRTVVVFSLYPAAAVLGLPYAESLALLWILLAAVALEHDRPELAVLPLIAAGLTRPTAVIVSAAVAVLLVQRWWASRSPDGRPLGAAMIAGYVGAGLAPFAGLGIFMAWLRSTGRPWRAPLDVQRELRAGFAEPISRFVKMVADVGTGHFHDVYNLGFTLVLIVAVVGALRARYSAAWTVYLIAGLLVALAANNVDSIGRYGVLLAPAWAVGLESLTRNRWVWWIYLAGSVAGTVFITAWWARGAVIP